MAQHRQDWRGEVQAATAPQQVLRTLISVSSNAPHLGAHFGAHLDGEFRAYLWGGEEAWLNQRVCVFAPLLGFPSAFVHRTIMPILAAVEASETATTVIHLGKNDIDRFKIVAPNHAILSAFGEKADPIYKRIVEQKQMARTLATLRDTLLPRLISGQLRLPA